MFFERIEFDTLKFLSSTGRAESKLFLRFHGKIELECRAAAQRLLRAAERMMSIKPLWFDVC